MASSTLLKGACMVAIAASASAFTSSPMGLAHRSSSHAQSAMASRASRGLNLRMQEVETKAPVEEVVDKALEVKKEGSATLKRGTGTQVRTAPEVNFYARTAAKLGWLKETSPLMTSTMAGNKGFDPAGFAKRNDLLLQYREAELKHARLAMLASVGWVVSELVHPSIAKFFGAKSLLQTGASGVLEKAPSVLNGGLDAVNPAVAGVILMLTGVIEIARMVIVAENAMKFKPGDYGFDPLNFYKGADDAEKRSWELKEINNGRLAMIAIAVFALQEYTGNAGIINLAPQFFTAGPLANIGNVGDLILQYTGLLSCQSGIVYCAEGQGALGAILTEDNGETAAYINELLSN